MANFDNSVIQFIEAYKLKPLNDALLTESVVNAILNSHRQQFDAWCKCPDWLKDKYAGKIPDDILSIAATSPNFTEAEAIKADLDHEKRNPHPEQENPDVISPTLDTFALDPVCKKLSALGVKFTEEHVTTLKENLATYKKGGYSEENAQKVATAIAARKACWDTRKEIMERTDLSQEEKDKQIKRLDEEHTETRIMERDAKRAELEYHPEKKLIRLMRQVPKEDFDPNTITSQMSELIQQIIAENKVDDLAKYMATPSYLAQAEKSKKFLRTVLEENGIDLNYLNKFQQDQSIQNKLELLRGKIRQDNKDNTLSSAERYQLRQEQLSAMESQLLPEDAKRRQAKLLDRDKIMAARLGIIPEYKTKTSGGDERVVKLDAELIKDGKLNENRISKEQFDALMKRKKELEGK